MAITAGSLGSRVEAYVGTITDEDNLSLWLTDGLRHVAMLVDSGEMAIYGKSVDLDPAAGTSIVNYRFLYATRNTHSTRIVPHELYPQFSDPASLHYITDGDPAVYFAEEKIFGFPATGTWKMFAVPIDTVLHTMLLIPNFPRSYEHIVVLYAAVQGATSKVKDSLANIANPLEDPNFDWTNLDLTSLASHFSALHNYLDTEEDIELAGAKIADINLELDTLKLNAIKAHDVKMAEWEARLRKYVAETQASIQLAQTARLVLDSVTATYTNALNAAFGGQK